MNWLIHWIATWLTSPHTVTLDGWAWLLVIPTVFAAVVAVTVVYIMMEMSKSFMR